MTYTLDLSRLNVAVERIDHAAEKAVRVGGEHVLSEANKTVPHDEGTLERSGAVDSEDTTAAVSYDTPYAVRQHENLNAHHQGKGRAKWLENTMAAEADAVAAIAARTIRAEVGL